MNLGLAASLVQHWNPTVSTAFDLRFHRLDWVVPGEGTIENPTTTLFHAGASVAYEPPGSRWGGSLSVRLTQRSFLKGAIGDRVILDPLFVPQVSIGNRWRLAREGIYTLSVFEESSLGFPVSSNAYKVRTSLSHQGKIEVRQEVGNALELQTGVFARFTGQSTDLVDQRQQDVGLELRFILPFGKPEF